MSKASAKQVMPIITVESADKARNFFVDTLGFDHVMGVLGKDGQLDFVTVVLNGARLMFARPHDNLPLTKAGSGKQPVEIYLEVGEDHRRADHSVVGRQDLQGHGPIRLRGVVLSNRRRAPAAGGGEDRMKQDGGISSGL